MSELIQFLCIIQNYFLLCDIFDGEQSTAAT